MHCGAYHKMKIKMKMKMKMKIKVQQISTWPRLVCENFRSPQCEVLPRFLPLANWAWQLCVGVAAVCEGVGVGVTIHCYEMQQPHAALIGIGPGPRESMRAQRGRKLSCAYAAYTQRVQRCHRRRRCRRRCQRRQLPQSAFHIATAIAALVRPLSPIPPSEANPTIRIAIY